MKHLYAIFTSLIALSMAMAVSAKGKTKDVEKDNGKEITAKVWFKNGSIYNGQLVKHWNTRRQTFRDQGHNFHTVNPDGSDKSIKHEAKDTDSILIISSTHEDFNAGDFYMAYNGEGRYALHKMLLRKNRGSYADIFTLLYWDVGGTKPQIQLMNTWYIIFHDNPSEIYPFYDKALQSGQRKTKVNLKNFCKLLEKNGRKELADAITQQFRPDKRTSKESEALIKENPSILLNFIDEYLSCFSFTDISQKSINFVG